VEKDFGKGERAVVFESRGGEGRESGREKQRQEDEEKDTNGPNSVLSKRDGN
jgi:hypothetical protein